MTSPSTIGPSTTGHANGRQGVEAAPRPRAHLIERLGVEDLPVPHRRDEERLAVDPLLRQPDDVLGHRLALEAAKHLLGARERLSGAAAGFSGSKALTTQRRPRGNPSVLYSCITRTCDQSASCLVHGV